MMNMKSSGAALGAILVLLSTFVEGAPGEVSDGARARGATPRPGPSASPSITFTRRYPVVGDIRTSKESSKMDMTFEAGGKVLRMERATTEESREEVLAVTSRIVTRMKVTYLQNTEVEKTDGKERVKRNPLVGRTFILEMKGGKAVALDAAARPLPESDARLVLADHKSFGKPSAMIDALPTTPLRVGDKVDALVEAFKKDFVADTGPDEKGEKTTLDGVTFTLKEIKTEGARKVGVLDFTMTWKIEQAAGFSVTMALKGTMTVRAQDGWPTVMAMEGPMSIMGKDNAGKLIMTKSVSYGRR